MRSAVFALLLAALGTGCVPVTEPVGDIDKAEPDKELLGQWQTTSGRKLSIDVQAVKGNPKGLMRAILSDPDPFPCWFHVASIGRDRYANTIILDDKSRLRFDNEGDFEKWQTGPRRYYVFRYTLDGDLLVIDAGAEKAFEALMKKEMVDRGAAGKDEFYRTPAGWLAKYLDKSGPKGIFDGSNVVKYERVKKK